MNQEEILHKINSSENSKIKFAVCDIDGILRGKYIHKNKFLSGLEKGLGFCDVIFGWDSGDDCYNDVQITGLQTGYPDAEARLDLSTFREIPWEDSQAFFLADFSNSKGDHKNVCPRSLLKKVLTECEEAGFLPKASFEYEWFNFEGTPNEIINNNFQKLQAISPGMFGYSVLRTSLNKQFFNSGFK